MDENIISRIVLHLSEKDLTRFALLNKQTYNYCTHTNVHNKKCNNKHITYHYTLSLLENAKLSYCVNILMFVRELYNDKIPLNKCAIHVSLKKLCGTIMKIIFGREIIINSIVYSYDTVTAFCDLQKIVNEDSKVYNINDCNNIERLKHKLNSIISHKYKGYNIKVINNVSGDFYHRKVDMFKKVIEQYFIKLVNII